MIEILIDYLGDNSKYIFDQFMIHIYISIVGVLLTILIGFPIGVLLSENKKLAPFFIGVINVIQTIPSIAMLIILLFVMGLGKNTVIVTVVLYSLAPLVSNTFSGLNNVDPVYVDSGRGVGMSKLQVLLLVKIPLAKPVILAGVRNSLVISVGITTIGSFVGAGGLGDVILRGINITEGNAIILIGAFLCAFITWAIDSIFRKISTQNY